MEAIPAQAVDKLPELSYTDPEPQELTPYGRKLWYYLQQTSDQLLSSTLERWFRTVINEEQKMTLSTWKWQRKKKWQDIVPDPISYTGIPCFSKVHFTSLHFHERTVKQYVSLLNKRKLKRIFFFLWKKGETAFSICFAVSELRGNMHPSSKKGNIKLLPQELHSASGHSCLELWASALYLDLFHVSVSKMCPEVTASLLYTIWGHKSFLRHALLSDSGGNLYTAIFVILKNGTLPIMMSQDEFHKQVSQNNNPNSVVPSKEKIPYAMI